MTELQRKRGLWADISQYPLSVLFLPPGCCCCRCHYCWWCLIFNIVFQAIFLLFWFCDRCIQSLIQILAFNFDYCMLEKDFRPGCESTHTFYARTWQIKWPSFRIWSRFWISIAEKMALRCMPWDQFYTSLSERFPSASLHPGNSFVYNWNVCDVSIDHHSTVKIDTHRMIDSCKSKSSMLKIPTSKWNHFIGCRVFGHFFVDQILCVRAPVSMRWRLPQYKTHKNHWALHWINDWVLRKSMQCRPISVFSIPTS